MKKIKKSLIPSPSVFFLSVNRERLINFHSQVLKAFASFLFSTKVNHFLQNHGVWKVASLGRLKTYCPRLTKPNNWLEESSGGSAHPLRTSRNNPAPWIGGSTFSAHQKACGLAGSFLFQDPVLTSGSFSAQDYIMTRLPQMGSSL